MMFTISSMKQIQARKSYQHGETKDSDHSTRKIPHANTRRSTFRYNLPHPTSPLRPPVSPHHPRPEHLD